MMKTLYIPKWKNATGETIQLLNYKKLYDAINGVQTKYTNYDKFVSLVYPMMKQVYNYLRRKGFSQMQTSGIMGNILQESMFDPSLRGGLTQFRGAHLSNYNNLYPEDSWDKQLDYLADWLNGNLQLDRTVNYNYMNSNYKKADHSNAKSSAEHFYNYWERPGSSDTSLKRRQEWADIFYRWFNDPYSFKDGGKLIFYTK